MNLGYVLITVLDTENNFLRTHGICSQITKKITLYKMKKHKFGVYVHDFKVQGSAYHLRNETKAEP